MKHLRVLFGFLFVLPLQAEMVRVTSVQDGRTIVVERNGRQEALQLAGIAVLDDLQAAELLRWSLADAWVLIEPHADGGVLVWRSPDALFANRELVLRGYARATRRGIEPERKLMVTYLGKLNPPLLPIGTATSTGRGTSSPRTSAKAPSKPRGSGKTPSKPRPSAPSRRRAKAN